MDIKCNTFLWFQKGITLDVHSDIPYILNIPVIPNIPDISNIVLMKFPL